MTSDDLKRLLLGPTLFRLDTIISPRLVPVLYAVGMASVLVWAVNHLFFSFGSNFGNGLWGLLEIVVFGLLALVVLRIVCEALLVFFKAHEADTETVSRMRPATNLFEDVKDAIHDLAEADEEPDEPMPPPKASPPAKRPSSAVAPAEPAKRGPAARRTARRTPKPRAKPKSGS